MTSSADQDYPREEFLVDFLYADRPRIASLSAQLFDDGHLTYTKKSSGITAEVAGKISGGIPGIARGETTGSDKTNESIERQFDATWVGPLNVLRELNAQGFITESIDSALLGQTVLITGEIQVVDLRMVQKLWRPIMMQEASKAMATAAKAQRAAVAQAQSEVKSIVEIVEQLPHTLQMRINSLGQRFWGTLDPEQMTVNPSDLAFKYGALIPGEWSVLALLDAEPSLAEADSIMAVVEAEGQFLPGMLQMLGGLRTMFGRGTTEYGVTPLAIYRKIERRASDA